MDQVRRARALAGKTASGRRRAAVRVGLIALAAVHAPAVVRASAPRDGPQAASAAVDSDNVLPLWRALGAQAQLIAERGAVLDARRALAEQIKALRLGPDLRVRDLVAESDLLSAALHDALRGAEELEVRPRADLPVLEVRLRLPADAVRDAVANLWRVYGRDGRRPPADVATAAAAAVAGDLEATGISVPPAAYVRRVRDQGLETLPEWALGMVEASATVERPTATTDERLAAALAAEEAARAELARVLDALPVTSACTVGTLAGQDSGLREALDALVGQALVTHTRIDARGASAALQLKGMRAWAMIQSTPPTSQPSR